MDPYELIRDSIEQGAIAVVGVTDDVPCPVTGRSGVLWHTIGLREAGLPEIVMSGSISMPFAINTLTGLARRVGDDGGLRFGERIAATGGRLEVRFLPATPISMQRLLLAQRRWDEVLEASGMDRRHADFFAVQAALLDGGGRLPHEPGHTFASQQVLYAAHLN